MSSFNAAVRKFFSKAGRFFRVNGNSTGGYAKSRRYLGQPRRGHVGAPGPKNNYGVVRRSGF
ncbi:hypothetical protein BX589_14340 [Paraburkholderia fungorum]|jgi:hypothetical protein|uniref:hypothetical protein n=1 Tax=Paraburkholderia fungorum TaxID=134537 RepID=UPI000D05C4E7|nr:hypothetical protein [Paraburkholderia fungorum]PRZ44873.1 hypothetical protein BX589_14340 [Paraburkholderia fungorum]